MASCECLSRSRGITLSNVYSICLSFVSKIEFSLFFKGFILCVFNITRMDIMFEKRFQMYLFIDGNDNNSIYSTFFLIEQSLSTTLSIYLYV